MPIQQLVSSSQKQINTISFNIDPDIASKALERRISQQREFIEKQLAEAQKDLMNNFTFTCPIPAKSGLCKGNPVRDDPGHLCAYHRKQNDDEFKKTLDPKTGKGWGRWVAPWIKPEKTAPKFEYELTAEQKEILKKTEEIKDAREKARIKNDQEKENIVYIPRKIIKYRKIRRNITHPYTKLANNLKELTNECDDLADLHLDEDDNEMKQD